MIDVSYIIPVSRAFNEGFDDRIKTLNFSLKNFILKQKRVNLDIIIVEQSMGGQCFFDSLDIPSQSYKHIKLVNNAFNKSWCVNNAVRQCKYKNIVLSEADMFCISEFYLSDFVNDCINSNRKWAIGWDKLYFLNSIQSKNLINGSPYDLPEPSNPSAGKVEGGIIYYDKGFFLSIGGMNEFYEGWGNDDNDMARRCEHASKSYPIFSHEVFHLYHEPSKFKDMQVRTRNAIWYEGMVKNIDKVSEYLKSKNFGAKEYPLVKHKSEYQSIVQGGTKMDMSAKRERIAQLSSQNSFRVQEKIHSAVKKMTVATPLVSPPVSVVQDKAAPGISIIVAVKNQIQYTAQFLADLYYCTSSSFELVVVDNGSTDGTVDLLNMYRERYKNVVIVNAKEFNNISKLWNLGVERSSREMLVICNNDIILSPNWDKKMTMALENNSAFAVVCPMSNYASIHQKPNTKIDLQPENTLQINKELEDHGKVIDTTNSLSGFFMMFEKKLLERVGMFYEGFEIGLFEDNYFFRQVLKSGKQMVVDGRTFIYHYGSRTFKGENIDMGPLFEKNKTHYTSIK